MMRHVHSTNMRHTKLLISFVERVKLRIQRVLKQCFGNLYDKEDDFLQINLFWHVNRSHDI